MAKKDDIEYLIEYRDGNKYMECRVCGDMLEVEESTTSHLCYLCVNESYNKDFPYKHSVGYKSSGRPRGWVFMKEFVDKDGIVFHKGKEQPDLKGTLKPTKPKPKKKVVKLSKAQRENLKRQALVTYHKLKKSLANAKTKKAKTQIKREIRKMEKIIK